MSLFPVTLKLGPTKLFSGYWGLFLWYKTAGLEGTQLHLVPRLRTYEDTFRHNNFTCITVNRNGGY
jgi:hypothetical protein